MFLWSNSDCFARASALISGGVVGVGLLINPDTLLKAVMVEELMEGDTEDSLGRVKEEVLTGVP